MTERRCLTKGAIYQSSFDTMAGMQKVSMNVLLPEHIKLSEDEAKILEQELHDAFESVLLKYWKEKLEPIV